MANSWFRFKQFTVHQKYSAMKVTTDACLFGSLQPVLPEKGKGHQILDIGAGTGLLSLMAAQLNPEACITAVEIEETAAREASQNFAQSPFANRIVIHHENILNFQTRHLFNLVICNPPFHQSQLNSSRQTRNIAHHEAGLKMEQLISKSRELLSEAGLLSLLLPYYREHELLEMAAGNGLYPQKLFRIRQTPKHGYFRSIVFLGNNRSEFGMEEILIRNESNDYSPRFQSLLSPFYLNL